MRYKLIFKLENEEIPIQYRKSVLSFIKKSLNEYSNEEYEKMYHAKDPIIKSYTFSIFFKDSEFKENAIIKAKYWAEKLNKPVIAEDSGISIDALDGYPGVFTKRCIEKLCPGANVNVDNPDELYPSLLKLMKESGNESTNAYWSSAIAFVCGEKEVVVEESISGDMCTKAGNREFGFDQYFKPTGLNKTLSELEPQEKDKIGPRRKAFEEILKQI